MNSAPLLNRNELPPDVRQTVAGFETEYDTCKGSVSKILEGVPSADGEIPSGGAHPEWGGLWTRFDEDPDA